MNYFFDDFDGDFDDDGFSDIFAESEMDEPETDAEDIPLEADDHSSGIGQQDWSIIGPVSEEIAREKAEEERLFREDDKDSENDD